MRLHQWVSSRGGWGIALALGVAFLGASVAFTHEISSSPAAAAAKAKIEATIFSYDGQDFIRTQTTLLTKDGKSAINTKLEHDTPAFEALSQKHSYSGEATVFGRKYDANYAPLTSGDGELTGALFVAVAK